MDLIGPIDPPSSKGHKCILCLVDQHTRWGEAMPVTNLSAKREGPGKDRREGSEREEKGERKCEKRGRKERRRDDGL
ncbi:hypothetical protein TNCV_1020561 [Trichonephila clavipes]|uniref:Uncharacterized protein n=1 Tax=Trichonephila clavipes TaxID=2585209 RepID=A0A8X6SJ20_TRICX|nr:hypothetical protein TNCV_1020561 [Trichonephila clavipes]